jgi:hypothetical protein
VKLQVAFGAAVAAAASMVLAGCAGEAPRPQARSYYSPQVKATPSRLTAEASAFEAYMRHARAISASFGSADQVSQALATSASHEPHQFESGMIAYAALAALQEPRFVEALQTEPNRTALARRLEADPNAVLQLPGGEAAAARASGALISQGEALRDQGQKVKRASYSVQHQAWSKRRVANPAGRLAQVKRLSAEPFHAEGEDSARIYQAMADGSHHAGPTGPAVTRAVAVAALNVLGEGGQARGLMSEPKTAGCLHLAKLNLFQCLSAAGPQYEDIYCLGQHAMADTGQCVVEATKPPRYASRTSYRR